MIGKVDRGTGAFEVSALGIRLESAVVVIRYEPHSRVHYRIDPAAVLTIRSRSKSVAVDDLSARRIRQIEAVALDAT